MSEDKICGVIMPISAIDGCDERHWSEVKEIVFESVRGAEMSPQLVSDDVEIGIIHKRIVQNIYDNPVVVCDISAKNPNVMLELGMRLAFDKPVVVIKDDKTNYSFDSSPIEHVTYPRDLRYQAILAFQATLKEKIRAMLKGSNENSFLKSFGAFKTSKLEHVEGGPMDVIMDELRVIKSAIRRQESDMNRTISRDWGGLRVSFLRAKDPSGLIISLAGPAEAKSYFSGAIKAMQGVLAVVREELAGDREVFRIKVDPSRLVEIKDAIAEFAIMNGGAVLGH
jgi:hypothetical protein